MLSERQVILRVFCNMLTKQGKKAKAEKLLFKTFLILRNKYKVLSPASLLLNLLYKYRPALGVMSKQIAATKVKLPIKLTERQCYAKIIRWLLIAAKKRSNSGYLTAENLAKEIFDTSQIRTFTFTKKQARDHKIALYDTRAFMHYLTKY